MERYSIFVDGKLHGRVNEYVVAANIYFEARKKYPNTLIKLIDNYSDEVEKETLVPKVRHKRVLSTVETGIF